MFWLGLLVGNLMGIIVTIISCYRFGAYILKKQEERGNTQFEDEIAEAIIEIYEEESMKENN